MDDINKVVLAVVTVVLIAMVSLIYIIGNQDAERKKTTKESFLKCVELTQEPERCSLSVGLSK